MLDDAHANRPCDDGSHRVLNVTYPYAGAQVVRTRLIRLLGANRVSQLRRVEEAGSSLSAAGASESSTTRDWRARCSGGAALRARSRLADAYGSRPISR